MAISKSRRLPAADPRRRPGAPRRTEGNDRQAADATGHSILDSLASRVGLIDESGRIVAVNESWRRFARDSGGDAGQVGRSFLEVCDIADEPMVREVGDGLHRVAAGELEVFETVYPLGVGDRQQWWLLRAVPYAGEDAGWVVVAHHDVTEARGDRELAHQQAAVLDQLDAAVYTTDLARTVLSWNAGAHRLFGWTAQEAIGRSTSELMLARAAPVDPGIRAAVDRGRWSGETELGRKDGSLVPVYLRTSASTNLMGETVSIAFIAIDISERLRSERELTAARDHLRAVADSIGEGMFTLDLDQRLTYMNPAAEHALGWSLDDVRGSAIQELVRSRHLQPPAEGAAGEVIRVEEDRFRRADGTDLSVAYTASPYTTDRGIEGMVVVFQDITERQAQARRLEREIEKVKWIKRIQDALGGGQFVLFAQPIVELRSDRVVQRELLIRMRDPEDPEKLIAPGAFLPVAEEYGVITDIDRWVIDQAMRLAAAGLPVELNVSALSIGDQRLIPYIEAALSRTGADPTEIVFEITETTLVGNERQGRHFVERMRDLGCRVALDDFGTGYGGFTYLKQLPIDFLKIDMEFVRDLSVNTASRNVVEAIVTLSERFGLETVAEGVEDAEILALLRELGVDYAQGYHIGRPAPVADCA